MLNHGHRQGRGITIGIVIFAASIILAALGGYGGSFQPDRIALLLLLLCVILRSSIQKKFEFIDRFTLFFLLSTFYTAVISMVWSYDSEKTFEHLIVLLVNFIPLLYLISLNQRDRLSVALVTSNFWMISAIVALYFGFSEVVSGNHYCIECMEDRLLKDNSIILFYAAGLFGNFNDYSVFLTICIFGMLNGVDVNNTKRLVYRSISLLSLSLIYLNGSKGCIIAATLIIITDILNGYGFKDVLLLITIIIIVSVIINFDSIFELISIKYDDMLYDVEGDDGRIRIWIAGVLGLFNSYGLGVGAGAYNEFYMRDFPLVLGAPHNLVLEWALSFSVIGALLLVLFFVFLCGEALKRTVDFSGKITIIITYVVIIPLLSIVQSHLIGFTYFWLFVATLYLYATVRVELVIVRK